MSSLYVAAGQVIFQLLPSKVQSKIFVRLQSLTFFSSSTELVQLMVFQTLHTIRSVMMVRSELYCLNPTSDKEHLLNFLVWWGWSSTGSSWVLGGRKW